MIINQLDNQLEQILLDITANIQQHNPHWVYIAINKYLITTQVQWHDLTDNYDQDLIDIVSHSIMPLGFVKINQCYLAHDDGRYFNFVHPTTNMLYQKCL
jgi:hypothetical protein